MQRGFHLDTYMDSCVISHTHTLTKQRSVDDLGSRVAYQLICTSKITNKLLRSVQFDDIDDSKNNYLYVTFFILIIKSTMWFFITTNYKDTTLRLTKQNLRMKRTLIQIGNNTRYFLICKV